MYKFTGEQLLKIRKKWDSNFINRIKKALKYCSNEWELTNIQLIPYFSQKCIFTCFSKKYGEVVLKVGHSSLLNEYNCMREFFGRNVCQVYEYNQEHETIIEQRIFPGYSLLNEKSQERRIDIFASLYRNLHVKPKNSDLYMKFSDWVKHKFNYIRKRKDCIVFKEAVDMAEKNYLILFH